MVYRGCGDYNWLSYWQSVDFPRYPLREMEALQKLYATGAWGNEIIPGFRRHEQPAGSGHGFSSS